MDKYRFFFLPLIAIILIILIAGCGSDSSVPSDPSKPSGWSKLYDFPPTALSREGRSVKQLSDGGYIIVGTAETQGNGTDILIIKTDAQGNIEGGKLRGGPGNDTGRSVQQTSDGGFIILGDYTAGSDRQMWLIKLDSQGNDDWDRFYGYSNYQERGSEVQQTASGGYILVGTTNQNPANVFLVRTDSTGNVIWYKQKGYDNSGESGNSVRQTSDGGFVLTGWTNQFDSSQMDLWLVKVDVGGNTVWHNHYGSSGIPDIGNSVRQTIDGGYIIAGSTWSSAHKTDCYLLKTDSVGNQQWSKTVGGLGNDWCAEVDLTKEGGYIATGVFFEGDNDGYLIKLDAQGTPLWETLFGGASDDNFYSVQATADGGFIMAGSTQEEGVTYTYLVKTDSEGNL